jgi:hypothetical protein
MQIQKMSMNWLPRASAWQEMEQARIKRQSYNQSVLSSSQSVNSTLIAANNTSQDSVNLTIQQAVKRIRSGTTKRV